MFRAFRSLFVIAQLLSLLIPLLGKGRRQKLPFLLKETPLFILTNWDLIWKFLEKRNWSFETIKDLLRIRKSFRK